MENFGDLPPIKFGNLSQEKEVNNKRARETPGEKQEKEKQIRAGGDSPHPPPILGEKTTLLGGEKTTLPVSSPVPTVRELAGTFES